MIGQEAEPGARRSPSVHRLLCAPRSRRRAFRGAEGDSALDRCPCWHGYCRCHALSRERRGWPASAKPPAITGRIGRLVHGSGTRGGGGAPYPSLGGLSVGRRTFQGWRARGNREPEWIRNIGRTGMENVLLEFDCFCTGRAVERAIDASADVLTVTPLL